MTSLADLGRSIVSRYFTSLQYSEYRKLWLSALASQSAVWALIVARAALVFEETGSAAWTGGVTFAAMIPSVFMAPIAGYLSDRFDRRTVLACAFSVNLAQNLVLAILVVTGAIEPWHVLVLSVINGSARATNMPSGQALLANLVPRQQMLNAVSLYQAVQQGARFSGPFLILLLLWITGHDDLVFFLCAGLYAVGLALVLNIRTASRGVVEVGKGVILRNLSAGLGYMYHNPLILSLILLVVAHCGMTMSFESLFPVFSREQLNMEGKSGVLGGASYLMVGYGAAALVTALGLAGVRSDRTRGRLILWLGVLSGITPVALALSPNLQVAMLGAAAMGFSQAGFMTLSHAMLQTLAPDAIRGRLLGVYSWHIQGFMASFNLVNGTLATIEGLTASIILGAGGIAFIVVMAGSFGRVPLRQLYARGVPAEAVAS